MIDADFERKLGSSPKVEKRRGKIAALAAALQRAPKVPLLRSRGVWFSTTQTDATMAKGVARAQLNGIELGELRLNSSAYELHPSKKMAPYTKEQGLCPPPWQWSHNRKHGEAIRTFLKSCKHHPRAKKDNEREIQWQLAAALEAGRKVTALRNLRPVTWNGLYTEIGVAVNRTGKIGDGTIDLIVRRRGGFLLFELKRPGETEVEEALWQVLRYANTFCFEANAGDENNRRNYRKVLGSSGSGKLRIGAVVVMEDDKLGKVRDAARKLLDDYWSNPGGSKIDRIGMLLYKFDREKRNVSSWEWLPRWDGRYLPLPTKLAQT